MFLFLKNKIVLKAAKYARNIYSLTPNKLDYTGRAQATKGSRREEVFFASL